MARCKNGEIPHLSDRFWSRLSRNICRYLTSRGEVYVRVNRPSLKDPMTNEDCDMEIDDDSDGGV